MRLTFNYISAICILCLFEFSLCFAGPSETDPYPSVDIPIYHKGYNVKERYNESAQTKAIIYHVQTDPPAREVIEFYDAELNARGWRSSFEICQRNWDHFSEGENTDSLSAKHLFASWQHLELNLKLDLWIRYERGHKDRQDEVVVNGLMQPLADN